MHQIECTPDAYAEIQGTADYPDIHGLVSFYNVFNGTIVTAEIQGLPNSPIPDTELFFGFHIHEGSICSGDQTDLLKNTGKHFNPTNREHPYHIGDLPVLLSVNGTAWSSVYTGKFHPEDVIGRTVVIHLHPDDYRTQPAGDSGMKIACGIIKEI
ncbi:MAG: superoxide dismutase family protein [Muricoprocola sp.]